MAEILLPFVASLFRTIFKLIVRWAVVQFGLPTLNRWVVGCIIINQVNIANVFVLAAFIQSSNLDDPAKIVVGVLVTTASAF